MKTVESTSIVMRLWGRFSRFRTIRDRLLVAIVLLVLLPVIIITVRSGYAGWQNGKVQVTRQLQSVATLKEAEIERWLDSLQMSLAAVLAADGNGELEGILEADRLDESAVQQVLSDWTRLIQYTGLFEEIFLMDAEGRVVLSNGPTRVDTIHRNQAYFREGLQGSFINPPVYSPTLSRMSVIVALPVLDRQGVTIGVLAGRVSIETLNRIMSERTGLGMTGETYLVGASHALLTNVLFVEADVQSAESTIFIRSEGANQALDDKQDGSGLYVNYNEDPVIGVFHWLPSLQVAIIAEQSREEAFASLRSSLLEDAIIAVAALISAIIATFYVTSSLSRPLQNLTHIAQEISDGNYGLKAETNREDEIGTLATAFNKMTANLNQFISDLEMHIHQLELAQASLEDSEDRYRTLYNNAPVMMHSIDTEGKLTNVNSQWLKTMGYEYSEVIGRPVTDFLTKASSNYAREHAIPLFLETGYVHDIAYQFAPKQGSPIDVLLTATARYDAQGEYQYSLAVIQDVTERRRAEESLRRSEGLLNATNQIAQTGGWELDLQTNELYWTDTIKEIHELPLDYVPNLDAVIKFYAPEHVPIIRSAIEGAIKGESYDVELQIVTAKQKRIWVRAIGVPVYENDEVVKVRGVFQDIHSHKLAREALHQSEANLREAQRIAKLGNFEFKLETQTVTWSDEVYRIFELPIGMEISLDRYQSLLAPEDFERVMTAVAETIENQQPYTIEHDIITTAGERKHLSAIGRPFLDEAGQVNCIFGIVQDITKTKQAEQELRRSEARHRALLEAMPDMMFRVNTEGTILDFKADNQDQLTLPSSEIIGINLTMTPIPSDIVEEMLRLVRQTAATAQIATLEYELDVPAGLQTFETRMIKSGEDEIIAFVRNITERRKILEALRRSEEHLNSIISNAPISMTVTNLAGRYLQVNDAMSEMIGYSKAELLELTFTDITFKDDKPIGTNAIARAIAGETDRSQYEKRYVHKDGHIIWAITSFQLVRDREGRPDYFIGQVQNITARKEAELRLSASLNEKEVLLKEIHHRVKNNLQVISSLLDLQSDYIEIEPVKAMFQESRSRVRSMALVHEQLYQSTDLARIDFGNYINGLTIYLSRVYGHLARQVILEVDVDTVLMSVEMAVPLGLIVNELVSNALKHAFPRDNNGQILIRLKPITSKEFRLTIQDNGIGMPANMEIRHSSSLGLTIVMTLIDQLQATLTQIHTESGTCLEIVFQIREKEA